MQRIHHAFIPVVVLGLLLSAFAAGPAMAEQKTLIGQAHGQVPISEPRQEQRSSQSEKRVVTEVKLLQVIPVAGTDPYFPENPVAPARNNPGQGGSDSSFPLFALYGNYQDYKMVTLHINPADNRSTLYSGNQAGRGGLLVINFYYSFNPAHPDQFAMGINLREGLSFVGQVPYATVYPPWNNTQSAGLHDNQGNLTYNGQRFTFKVMHTASGQIYTIDCQLGMTPTSGVTIFSVTTL